MKSPRTWHYYLIASLVFSVVSTLVTLVVKLQLGAIPTLLLFVATFGTARNMARRKKEDWEWAQRWEQKQAEEAARAKQEEDASGDQN